MKEKIKRILLAESNWFFVTFLVLTFGTIGYFIWFFEIKNEIVEWNKLRTEDVIYILATLLLAVIAIFRESLERIISKPELKIRFYNRPPYSHRTVMDFYPRDVITGKNIDAVKNIPVYYFSFLVENKGKKLAKNCEAVLEEVYRKNESGIWIKEDYLPTNLTWVVQDNPQFISINPGRNTYCNIGHILHPAHQYREVLSWRFAPPGDERKTMFKLELMQYFYYQRDYLSPGEYRIKIVVYSENAKKNEKTYNIRWSGLWKDTEEEILNKEIEIKPITHPML